MSRKPLPEGEKPQAFSIRISPDLKKRIDAIAAREERSVNNTCNILLRRAVDEYEKSNK